MISGDKRFAFKGPSLKGGRKSSDDDDGVSDGDDSVLLVIVSLVIVIVVVVMPKKGHWKISCVDKCGENSPLYEKKKI